MVKCPHASGHIVWDECVMILTCLRRCPGWWWGSRAPGLWQVVWSGWSHGSSLGVDHPQGLVTERKAACHVLMHLKHEPFLWFPGVSNLSRRERCGCRFSFQLKRSYTWETEKLNRFDTPTVTKANSSICLLFMLDYVTYTHYHRNDNNTEVRLYVHYMYNMNGW